MSANTRSKLKLAIIPLAIMVVIVQAMLDPQNRKLHANERSMVQGLSNEFILGPLLGMQQAVAGLLWIRADEFFHEGDYDAILPVVRMVTWLDPHALDVYITGAWHLAYNFTDSSERSDRRYIPAAQALLEEGYKNNPEIYDIPFEIGWQASDKIKDYTRAEKWFKIASTLKAADEKGELKKEAPAFVKHMLAHAFARQGRIDESIKVWDECLVKSEQIYKDKPADFAARSVRDSERHNRQLTLKRRYSRNEHEINFDLDQKLTKGIDEATGAPVPLDAAKFLNQEQVANRLKQYKDAGEPAPLMDVGQLRPPAVQPKWNTAFNVRPVFSAPKILELKGQFNVGDGARVYIRMHDEGWRERSLKEFAFEVNQDQTIMVDMHSVRSGAWGRKIDMSKDPKMYSFKSDKFYLVFEFNPNTTSPFIQDRFGWNGEGLGDAKYMWTDTTKVKPVHLIRKVYLLSREQILGSKPIREADVVPNEVYGRLQAGTAVGTG